MKLEIAKANALTAYKKATKEGKALLENLFGKEVLSEKITERIKSFDNALEEIGGVSENAMTLLKYNGIDRDMIAAQAHMKLSIIARALNEGWKPDWTNSNEAKWYPYFSNPSGFGFSHTDFYYCFTTSTVGSRLCFKSSELAEYAGKQFESIYNDFLNL